MAFNSTLPNNYQKNNKGYQYKIPDGLPTNFFVNGDPLDYADFANLILSVFTCDGTEAVVDANPLQKVDLGGGTYRIYSEDIIITGLVHNKSYRYVIYDSVTDAIILMSDQTWKFVESPDQYVKLSYRNSSNTFNYNYEELPDYRNIVYVDMNLVDNQAEYDITSEFDATTNTSRNQKTSLKDSVTLEGYFFDEIANNAMKVLSLHNDILINGRSYGLKKGYEFESNIRARKNLGTIELWDNGNNQINYPS